MTKLFTKIERPRIEEIMMNVYYSTMVLIPTLFFFRFSGLLHKQLNISKELIIYSLILLLPYIIVRLLWKRIFKKTYLYRSFQSHKNMFSINGRYLTTQKKLPVRKVELSIKILETDNNSYKYEYEITYLTKTIKKNIFSPNDFSYSIIYDKKHNGEYKGIINLTGYLIVRGSLTGVFIGYLDNNIYTEDIPDQVVVKNENGNVIKILNVYIDPVNTLIIEPSDDNNLSTVVKVTNIENDFSINFRRLPVRIRLTPSDGVYIIMIPDLISDEFFRKTLHSNKSIMGYQTIQLSFFVKLLDEVYSEDKIIRLSKRTETPIRMNHKQPIFRDYEIIL